MEVSVYEIPGNDKKKIVILTDYVTRNLLLDLKIVNTNLLFWNAPNFIQLKVGNTLYLLFNNGKFPFSSEKITKNTILIPVLSKDADFKIAINSLKEIDVVNLLLQNKFEEGGLATIPISDENPKYFLDKPNPSKDIRFTVRLEAVDNFNKLPVFSYEELVKNRPIILMSFLSKPFSCNTGFAVKKNVKLFAWEYENYDIEFIGDKWYLFLLTKSFHRIEANKIGGPENRLAFLFDVPNFVYLDKIPHYDDIPTKRRIDLYYQHLKYEFREFEKVYENIDYFFYLKKFYDRSSEKYYEILKDVLSFKLICIKLEDQFNDYFTKIIYHVVPNGINFKMKLSIKPPKIFMPQKSIIEIELFQKELIAEEELKLLKENAKKSEMMLKKALKLKEIAESKYLESVKSILKLVAEEAVQYVKSKESDKTEEILHSKEEKHSQNETSNSETNDLWLFNLW